MEIDCWKLSICLSVLKDWTKVYMYFGGPIVTCVHQEQGMLFTQPGTIFKSIKKDNRMRPYSGKDSQLWKILG